MTPTPFDAKPDDSMPPMSRRHFATLVAATTLSACGGGGGGGSSAPPAPAPAPSAPGTLPPAPAPVIPPPPPPAAPAKPNTLSFVAGGLGGRGFAPAARIGARFANLEGMAAKPDGTLLVNFDLTVGALAEAPTNGMLLLDPAQPDQPARSVPYYYRPRLIGVSNREMGLDGNGRFVFSTAVSQQVPDGVLIWRLDGVTATFVAGGASATTLTLDGSGANAKLCGFGSPCTVSTGLTYFLDAVDLYGKTALRTLDGQGMVKTVISDSPPGTLVLRSNGGLLLFSYFRNGAAELTSTGQWYELLVAPDGTHSWRTLSTNWPTGANLLIPLGLVGGTTDTYWCRGFLGNAVTYRQCRLDGTLLNPAVTVPNASGDAVSGGNLVTVQEGCSVVVFGPAGVELARYGTPEARGQLDGQGSQARLDLQKTTSIYQPGPEAYTDPNGDLYVTNNGTRQPSYPINDGNTYSTPMRRITPQGQVTSLALKSSGLGLTRHADGDWLTAGDANFPRPSSNTAWLGTGIFKAPGDGSGQWKLWAATAATGAPVKADLAYTRALRTDSAGNLYFAEGSTSRSRNLCFLPCATPTKGGNMVGLVSPGGQAQAVAGIFDGQFTANDSYPIESQRPWYYDVVDFALETDQVAWVLCSRPAGTGETPASPYKPVLYRVTAGVPDKRIELPSVWTGGSNDVYTRICVLRGRPGEVFLAGYSAVYRWTEAQGLTVLAGNPSVITGVQLGTLPAGLGEVTFLAPGPVANSLYVGSENSVLQISLP